MAITAFIFLSLPARFQVKRVKPDNLKAGPAVGRVNERLAVAFHELLGRLTHRAAAAAPCSLCGLRFDVRVLVDGSLELLASASVVLEARKSPPLLLAAPTPPRGAAATAAAASLSSPGVVSPAPQLLFGPGVEHGAVGRRTASLGALLLPTRPLGPRLPSPALFIPHEAGLALTAKLCVQALEVLEQRRAKRYGSPDRRADGVRHGKTHGRHAHRHRGNEDRGTKAESALRPLPELSAVVSDERPGRPELPALRRAQSSSGGEGSGGRGEADGIRKSRPLKPLPLSSGHDRAQAQQASQHASQHASLPISPAASAGTNRRQRDSYPLFPRAAVEAENAKRLAVLSRQGRCERGSSGSGLRSGFLLDQSGGGDGSGWSRPAVHGASRVELTGLGALPGFRLTKYLGAVSLHFIKEHLVLRAEGDLGNFFLGFLLEVMPACTKPRAWVAALLQRALLFLPLHCGFFFFSLHGVRWLIVSAPAAR